MTGKIGGRKLLQAIGAVGAAALAAPHLQEHSDAHVVSEVEEFDKTLGTLSTAQSDFWTSDQILHLGQYLSQLQLLTTDLGEQMLQVRWSPPCAGLTGPLVSLPRGVLMPAGGSGSAQSWQPSFSAVPDAGRLRQPMTGTRLASAQRQAAVRGTSTSARACKIAAEHASVVVEVRKTLSERGVALPRSHFADPDVELARYAVTVGLLTAKSPEEKQLVVEAAATRAQQTVEWLESHCFMPEAELDAWAHVVHWAADDEEGHPVLVVHLAAGMQQDAADADAAAEAILAHMEYALAHRLSDMPGRPEQLTVVLDSRGAPTLQFRKLVRTIQNIALDLNRHYPARLHRLFLVGAPAIVHLPVRAIRTMLHPSTSQKIIICDSGDPRLPLDIAPAAASAEEERVSATG